MQALELFDGRQLKRVFLKPTSTHCSTVSLVRADTQAASGAAEPTSQNHALHGKTLQYFYELPLTRCSSRLTCTLD